MENYSHSHTDLSELGYVTIPVYQNGTPVVRGFLDRETPYPLSDILDWCENHPDTSVALVCGKADICALDFDVDDEYVSKELVNYLKNHYPFVAFRKVVGQQLSHRFAIVFRKNESLKDYSNGSSARYYFNDSVLNQIEYIGNKLITILGAHRKSGGIYHWDYPLCKTKIDDLPVLGKRDLDDVFALFKRLMTAKGYQAKSTQPRFTLSKEVSLDETFMTTTNTKVYKDDEVKNMLSRYSGDAREDWLRMGMALHSNYNGSDKGFDLWDDWSSKFQGYAGTSDCRMAWDRFKVKDGGVTFGSIKYELKSGTKAQEAEVTPEKKAEFDNPLEEALHNLIYIAESDEVGDISKSVPESVLPMRSMRNQLKNKKVAIPQQTSKGVVLKETKLLEAWLEDENRQTVHSRQYIPIPKRVVTAADLQDTSRELSYYNTYIPPSVEYTRREDLVSVFTDHIEYMFESDPDWVYTWLAQIIQQPMIRHRTALYSIATNTGTGRGWLSLLMGKLFGDSNVSTLGSMSLLTDPSAKTGFLHNTVMLVINETDTDGRSKYKVNDRLKTIISDDRQEVNIKYGTQSFNQRIYTRVFMQSNAIGNLVIEPNDNRIQVFINMKAARDLDYYTRLYEALENPEFINQVHSWLQRYNVDVKKVQVAKLTEEKKIVIAANTTPTAAAFYEFISVVGSTCFTRKDLLYGVESGITMGDAVNHAELRHLMNDHLPFKRQFQIKGVRQQVYSTEISDKLIKPPQELWDESKLATQKIGQYYESN